MKFVHYIFTRITAIFMQIIGVIVLTFVMVDLMPYDPTLFFLISFRGDPSVRDKRVNDMRESFGLNDPLYERIGTFLIDLFTQGSLGHSWTTNSSINAMVSNALPYTIITFGLAFMIYTPLSFFLGLYAARNRGKFIDLGSRIITTATYSIPSYILGLWLVIWGIPRGLAPWPSFNQLSTEVIPYLFLPVLTVILVYTGFQFRIFRNQVLSELNSNYIRTARAKGLSERKIIYKHLVRNLIGPFLNTVAVTFPIAFSGVAAIEVVFNIQGIGQLMVYAATQFDWPIIIGTTVVFVLINGITLAVTDTLVHYFTPKSRHGQIDFKL